MPHEIDLAVGQEIRIRRKLAGLSQTNLAATLGVAFQQLQKYESGANRVSASRLYAIARALGCEPGALFPDMAAPPVDFVPISAAAAQVAREFMNLPDENTRDAVASLIRKMARP